MEQATGVGTAPEPEACSARFHFMLAIAFRPGHPR
jgi:hypothetical protein